MSQGLSAFSANHRAFRTRHSDFFFCGFLVFSQDSEASLFNITILLS
ncbi:hypothetical protein HMPREF9419_2045 [Prevotella nigrescens ATCC 33563]|nr:hypothetical protein HMPREF9419_2045 [Prevotella nigrescens ATCC 33563]